LPERLARFGHRFGHRFGLCQAKVGQLHGIEPG
jgi:hypothetical protein